MDETSSGDCTRMVISFKSSVFPAKFATHEFLLLTTVLDTNVGLPSLVENLEGEVLNIGLDLLVIIFTADETLGIEDTNIGEMRQDEVVIRLSDFTYVLCGFIAT